MFVRRQRHQTRLRRRRRDPISYLELTKPRITGFILMSTAIGFLCGANFAGLSFASTWLPLIDTLDRHGIDRQRNRGSESMV